MQKRVESPAVSKCDLQLLFAAYDRQTTVVVAPPVLLTAV